MSRNRVLVLFLTWMAIAVAAQAQSRINRAPADGADSIQQTISGTVVDFQGSPLANARVDLTDSGTGQVQASAYSGNDGHFGFSHVPPGSYEVVATKGVDEARERVGVAQDEVGRTVQLRFPGGKNSAANAGGAYSVSVAQMQIPEKARKAYRKAEEALHDGKSEEAGKYIEQALALAPNFADALTLRGVLKLDASQYEPARTDMERAVELDPSNGMSLIALGAAYNALQRYDDALRVLRQGISLAPTAWQGYFEMGKTLVGQQHFEDALTQLGRASDLVPKGFPAIHLVKANAYLALKNYEQSMSELQQYLNQDPRGAKADQVRDTLQRVRAFAAVSGGQK